MSIEQRRKFLRCSLALLALTAGLIVSVSRPGAGLAQPLAPQTSDPTPPPAVGSKALFSTPQLIQLGQATGRLDQYTADLYLAYALADHGRLPEAYHGGRPWDGTTVLMRLHQRLQKMAAGAERDRLQALLASFCSGESTSSLPYTYTSPHFYIQFGALGGGLTISQYAQSLETAWNTEVITFGWAAPPVYTVKPAPGSKYFVRIDNLGEIYGLTSPGGTYAGPVNDNPNTPWVEEGSYATCMVLNSNYSKLFPSSPQNSLDATTAHEFNHALQYGYGAVNVGITSADMVIYEGGATWMEDEVFNNSNDNYNYLWPKFNACLGEYVDETSSNPNSPYPYWVIFRAMTEPFGTGTAGGGQQVMKAFWELTSQNKANNLSALDTALKQKSNGQTDLATSFHTAAIALKFNKACTAGYTYPYCLKEGPAYEARAGATKVNGTIAAIGGSYSGTVVDSYSMNWVSLPASGRYDVTLRNTAAGGILRGSVVCDTGSRLDVHPMAAVANGGGVTTLTDIMASGCISVVAVITDQFRPEANPDTCPARSYKIETKATVLSAIKYHYYLPYTSNR